jgi:hypothetical protein
MPRSIVAEKAPGGERSARRASGGAVVPAELRFGQVRFMVAFAASEGRCRPVAATDILIPES